jgi:hypothetical protein
MRIAGKMRISQDESLYDSGRFGGIDDRVRGARADDGAPDSKPGSEGWALRPARGWCALPDVGCAVKQLQ